MLKRFSDFFVRTYLSVDPRSLAAGRIALASVLLMDCIKRWFELSNFYCNDGLVPNHTLLWRPSFTPVFSLFFLASYKYEAAFLFVLCTLAYLALLLGIRTRAAQIASWIAMLSLHGRLLIFDNGGDVVLGLLTTWTMFMPTGRYWSVDAVLARRRAALAAADAPSAAASADAPSPADAPTPTDPRSAPVVSFAALAVVFQLAAIYFFNAIHKNGVSWREGSAVHYALHLDRLATWFGVWLREAMSPQICRLLTWSALAVESALPVLILSPVLRRYCRPLAILLVVNLHLGFAACLNLGVFVPAMIAFTPNLLVAENWQVIERWWARRTSLRAYCERVASLIMRAADRLTPGRSVRVSEPGPWAVWLRRARPIARELVIAFFVFIASNQLLDENPGAHRVIDHHNSPPVAAGVTYLDLFQGWVMFAPDAPMSDLNLMVDATTTDGRHVDPFNEVANPRYPQPGKVIPPATGTSWLFYGYVNRLPGYPAYNQALQEWILRYPERTGNKRDTIRRFEVYTVEDDSPRLGEHAPRNQRSKLLFHYP